ncbi:MAG: alginate lyase family protein [Acidobacteriaceae bacterium]
MRPLWSIVPALRRQPPAALAREAVWRIWKPCRSVHLRAALNREETSLCFRPLPWFSPDLEAVQPAAPAITGIADQLCAGEFPLLGYATAKLGFPPAWNLDFVSGFAWQSLAAAQLKPVVRHNGSDVKVPWELSRLQFLPVLAKAHLLTGESRYREAARDLSTDWISKNPVGVGVNWTLAMESALRGISICALLSLLQPLRPEEENWGKQIVRSIAQHLRFTESHLEFSHLVRSNHYLGNIVGLFCMASFLEYPSVGRRRRLYQRRVEEEIFRQTYPDGGDYEASLGYQVLVLQMFLTAFLVMRAGDTPPSVEFTARLTAMFRSLAEVAGDGGCVPHVGDCDDGRVELWHSDLRQMLSLPPEQRNSLLVPGLLSMGAALFGLSCGGDPSDAAWYGLHPATALTPRPHLAVLPNSGIAVGRNHDAEVIFCALPNGIGGLGSHTHNDKLSIVARIGGSELLCDSGTFCYTRDAAQRNVGRSTAAHNTIAIDAAEQNEINLAPAFVFSLGNQAVPTSIEAAESSGIVTMTASHSGYQRIGVHHRRSLTLEASRLIVHDELSGSGRHGFELFWHLPALWNIVQSNNYLFQICGPRAVTLRVDANLALTLSLEPHLISRTYGGATETGHVIRIRGRGQFPATVTTTFHWLSLPDHPTGPSVNTFEEAL